jgi:hypothetical protein
MISQGYVAIFSKPLDAALIAEIIQSWLNRFEKVEQVAPHTGSGPGFTLAVKEPRDVMLASDALQFRVMEQTHFAWIYLTRDRRAIETSGFAGEDGSLALEVLFELPHATEIVAESDERRLDELEAEGLL